MTPQPLPLPARDPFQPAVVRRPPTLADLLRREMDQRGITAIIKLAEEMGVGYGTAYRLLQNIGDPSESTLERVAAFLRLPITEVRQLADQPAGEIGDLPWPDDLKQLTRAERDFVVAVARTIRKRSRATPA